MPSFMIGRKADRRERRRRDRLQLRTQKLCTRRQVSYVAAPLFPHLRLLLLPVGMPRAPPAPDAALLLSLARVGVPVALPPGATHCCGVYPPGWLSRGVKPQGSTPARGEGAEDRGSPLSWNSGALTHFADGHTEAQVRANSVSHGGARVTWRGLEGQEGLPIQRPHSLNLSHHKHLLSANHMPGAQDEQTEDQPRTWGETQGNAQTGPFDLRSPTGQPAAPLGHKNVNK